MANGAAGASAAAAEEKRRQDQEEEEMTMYSPEEMNKYEFKIVRANYGVFGKPAEFNKLIQGEARAGWEMVEKFDNQRVRFKRPINARERDGQLPPDVDPYRTQYGMAPWLFALLLVAVVLVGFGLIVVVVAGLIVAILGAGSFFIH
jgi:hypothetical protein